MGGTEAILFFEETRTGLNIVRGRRNSETRGKWTAAHLTCEVHIFRTEISWAELGAFEHWEHRETSWEAEEKCRLRCCKCVSYRHSLILGPDLGWMIGLYLVILRPRCIDMQY